MVKWSTIEEAEARKVHGLRILTDLQRPAEQQFSLVTALAADLFQAPLALVSLTDAAVARATEASLSSDARSQTSRSQTWTFNAETLKKAPGVVTIVTDASKDPRFASDLLVTGPANIRFYVGVILASADGRPFGTLCVVDTRPHRRPIARKIGRLQILAKIVVKELELAHANRLASEKHRLLQMTESVSGVGHWRVEVASGKVRWSDAVYAIHGLRREDFEPNLQSALSLYHAEDQALVAQCIDQAIAEAGSFSFQRRIRHTDGEIRDVLSKGVCELDPQGCVTAVFGVFQDVTEQARALNAAKRSEQRYRLLADNVGDVITRMRLDGASNYISPAIERVLGYHPTEMAGRPAQTFVHDDDRAMVLRTFSQMSRGLEQQTLQHRALHKDGRTIWVETGFRLVRDNQGRPVEIMAVIRDATERKRLEDATVAARDEAREQARRAAMAERMAGVGHWRYEAATRSVSWSEQMYLIYGLDPKLPLDVDVLMAMSHPEDQDVSNQRLRDALSTGSPMEEIVSRIVRPDGQVRYILGSGAVEKDAAGRVIAVVGTMRDITEQRQSRIALAQSEARYRLLAENASDLIMHSDVNGRVTYISPSVLALTGYAPDDVVGSDIFDWIEADDVPKIRAAVAAQFNSRGAALVEPVEFRIRHREGHELWLEGRPTLAFDTATGAITGITDVVRDISARRSLEAELRAARVEAEAAVAVKSEFLANMSHELRTPLTAVLGFSRLAEEQPELSETTRGYLRHAANAGRALLSTVNDILDFSKLEAGQVEIDPRWMSLSQMATETLDLFAVQAATKGLTLILGDLELLPRAVFADPDRMRQILLNLLGNAVKFTMEGCVRLDVCFDYQAERVTFVVTDSGPGISEAQAKRLFQRFSQVDASLTRKHGGTGLGLAICKGLAEAMGGEIGVRSKTGEGACFWFAIPAQAANTDAPTEMPPEKSFLASGCRVLVADDHRTNRELVRAMLAPFDVEFAEADDGLSAVAAAQTSPFDIILMDLRMPGLDGLGAARRIRAESGPNSVTPILAFSADADQIQATDLFDGFVGKPLKGEKLLKAMSEALWRDIHPS